MLRLHTKTLAADSSALSQLPPELILRIASYLLSTSAGAFSLCTKRLYALLAIPYLKCQHGYPPFNKSEFLRLLEPSLPDHIVCYHCEKLHAIKHSKRHIQFTKRCDIKVNESMRSYIHPRFSYVVFQMVMKRYRQGLDYSSLLKLLPYDEWSWVGPDQIKASTRIITAPSSSANNTSSSLRNAKIMICPHAKQLRGKINCSASAPEKYSLVYTTGSVDVDRTSPRAECDCCPHQDQKNELLRCRECATEFRIDTLGIGKEGKAFVVTRWKDLGEGREVGDPVWQAHLREGVVGGEGKGGRRRRSICERFEGKGWRGGLEGLVTPRVMKRLMRYRYCFCEV
ncbi:hypothetical protein VE03_06931 [Pseudogymnoascus sp. 23342-1-I1]|nr:hypothetical protein VE03_06931 [Pseudogymnoascus sp. 23342-1-I1]